jgi:uncharacterized membrane protein HdeD (DUF308 family)
MVADELDYVVGVDTHRDEHVLAVVVAPVGAVVARRAVAANARGYAQALRFADSYASGRRVWAVEGAGHYGVAVAAGVLELGVMLFAQGWWKLLYGVLAVIFIAAGIVSFIHPGDTFLALAAVISFFLVFAGTFDIITAISARREVEVWWLQLIGGIIELALGFWAAGYYGRSAILLVAWVAAFAVIRGVNNIVLAFRVREIQHPASV